MPPTTPVHQERGEPIEIVDVNGQPVGRAEAHLVHQANAENPLRWSGTVKVPSTPGLLRWLKGAGHEILFRTEDGRAARCVSYRLPNSLPASIDVFGGKAAPFD